MKPMRDIRLYFFVRTDMESMTPGRVAAQVSHATSYADQVFNNLGDGNFNKGLYDLWGNQTKQNFGTAIILDGCDIEHIKSSLLKLSSLGIQTGMVIDPSYSVPDGDVTHYLPIETVGWALIDVDNHPTPAIDIVKSFDLYTETY